jgi:predicted nucleic acid-binding protein
VYHLGRALNALELVNEYVKGRVDSELLDAIQNHSFREHERAEERWERLERGQSRILANQELLLEHFRSLTGRLTKLEGQHAGNHPVTLSVPPSTRDHDVEAKEA